MLSVKKLVARTLMLLLILYVLICTALYFFQEKLLFFPDKLGKDHHFSFAIPFEELAIRTGEGISLNGLMFPADSARGLVFYLHGNGGSLESWGGVAQRYTDLHYSVFMLDYPGYGKSEGSIHSQAQLFDAIQAAYDTMKKRYREDHIVVLGYSIGTGLAAHLAAPNHPRLLMLQAPYYSLTDMMRHAYPVIPTFLLRYRLRTNEYLARCTMPVVLFHGDQDEVVYYGSSLKLEREFKPGDTLITLRGQGHNGMTDNPDYLSALQTVLK
ncbi:MAG: hydrolase [Flaviaesturariibacter sp.]|nr:hydrolase [Flaviaesturariibacter sp.]